MANSVTIREQIDGILAERKKKAEDWKQKRESLKKLRSYLTRLEEYKGFAKKLEDEKLRATYGEKLGVINTSSVNKEIYDFLNRINNAVARLERDRISIATVGKARQGKSTFLQSVGNLGNNIIPAFDTGDCTGATSVIYNCPEMPEGTVSAFITFKRQEDLVDTVKAYINQIDPSYDLRDFKFLDIGSPSTETMLTEMEEKIGDGEAKKTTALNHLKNIVSHYDEISELFGHSPMTLTDPNMIQQYVAQNDGAANEYERQYFYNYLAVARAEISCRFYEDCGKIVLVDTIGLGDTQVGIDGAMLDTVDKECDAAIVVTKPISAAHEDDFRIYDLLRKNFKNRNMKEWLFYAANLHKGQNDNVVDAFERSISGGNFDICFCKKIDCSDKQTVNEEFMKPLLEKLVENMGRIDDAYLNALKEQGKTVMEHINRFIASLPDISEINPSHDAALQAYISGQKTYNRMTAELKNQALYWKKEKDQPNGKLWNRIQVILNKMDDIVPSAEKLQKLMDENGNIMPNTLWEIACNYVRNEITDAFNGIDEVMKREARSFKNSLVEHMYYALNDIFAQETGEKSAAADSVDMLEWLQDMMDNVIGDQQQYRQIYKAFYFLYNFEFSIKENIIQEVRRQLYTLNPIADGYYAPAYQFSPQNTGEEVYYYLTSRLAVMEDELRHSLSKLYRRPNQIFYAAAEEFYDRITFAIDFNDNTSSGSKDMSVVWGNFFMQYSTKIWQSNADRFKQVNELITKYKGTKALFNEDAAKIVF